ncbi:Hypothetical predicted protein [Xyrichtys novacula]|uniref:Uncharacterized protein n=1 Tax=Xyrichtys novacula TaxID=13765 RepID=A0AAV1HP43_XYRNO|nr:Hypothetical predicted protein [Xyrichtys novacula]
MELKDDQPRPGSAEDTMGGLHHVCTMEDKMVLTVSYPPPERRGSPLTEKLFLDTEDEESKYKLLQMSLF